MTTGIELRDEALARVEANADVEWKLAAELVVHLLAAQLGTFTSDDVWEGLVDGSASTHEPRALGAVLKRVAKDGVIAPTDEWRISRRPECHGRPVRVWRAI